MSDIHIATKRTAPAPALATLIGKATHGPLKAIGRGFGSFIKHLQYSRMLRVLREMSDADLEQIGITRADIPRHAALLVDFEYDGL